MYTTDDPDFHIIDDPAINDPDLYAINDPDLYAINDPDFYTINDPDFHAINDPDFHIIDGVETIYEEDLEAFENKSNLTSDSELQDIDDLNENTVTYFTKELASSAVYHTLTPIEYPETSLEGIAYVYNVEGWKELLDAFKD
ncbi:8281_t:CDS:2, partial [Scutellospora calospora]